MTFSGIKTGKELTLVLTNKIYNYRSHIICDFICEKTDSEHGPQSYYFFTTSENF